MFGVLLHFISSAHAIFGGLPLPAVFQNQSPVVHIETSMFCTAIVLDSQTLLTAAHCTIDLSDVNYQIKVINPDTKASTRARISRVIRHAEFKSSFVTHPTVQKTYTDIAVIKLSRKISFPHLAALLPQHSIDLHQSSTWLIANGSTKKADRSRNQSIPVKMSFGNYNSWITESLRKDSGPCAGDSGGGYFAVIDSQAYLVGIQSTRYASYKCDDSRNRGLAVDVRANLEWILRSLN